VSVRRLIVAHAGLRWLVILTSLVAGCAPHIQPLGPSGVSTLAPGEGLLILHVDTDVPVEALLLDSGVVAESIQQGEHIWFVRARARRYRWTAVRFGAQAGRRQRYRLDDDEEFRFDVAAGRINYAGALIIRSPHMGRSVVGNVRIRHRNHAAMAIRELRDRHASLLRSLPLHHAGPSGDRFLERYQRVRDEADSRATDDEAPM
jgi:hypothetical protein